MLSEISKISVCYIDLARECSIDNQTLRSEYWLGNADRPNWIYTLF